MSGVGGTPVTVRHQYRTYPDLYHYVININPVNNKNYDHKKDILISF